MTKTNEMKPLYRVLFEEYAAQFPPLASEEDIELKYEELRGRYGLPGSPTALGKMEEDARELVEKKVNSAMVKWFYSLLHGGGRPRAALCFSGGGIRSATFGLGVLQGLARRGLLDKFDYLSTVSGGGYLGGWLSAWIHRRGLEGVVKRLVNEPKRRSPLQPEAEPVKHLRSYSNYMSPKVGLLSADTWTLAAIYFRNLLLNWLVLVPLILAALILPRLFVWLSALAQKDWSRPYAASFGLPLVAVGLVCGIVAVAYIYASRPSLSANAAEGERTRLRVPSLPARLRSQKWFLWLCLLPFGVLAVASTLAYAWLPAVPVPSYALPGWLEGWRYTLIFVVYGAALYVGGFLVAFPFLRRTERPLWKRLLRYLLEFVVALAGGALSGLLTWVVADELFPPYNKIGDTPLADWTAFYAVFALPLFLLLILASVTIFIGLTSRVLTDPDREWLARAGGWILIVGAAWLIVSAVVVYGPVALAALGTKMKAALASTSLVSGLVTLVFGRSARSPANNKEEGRGSTTSALAGAGLTLAAAIFTASILVLLSLATGGLVMKAVQWLKLPPPWGSTYVGFDRAGLLDLLYFSPGRVLVLSLVTFVAVSFLMGVAININKFSLHGAYRDRLIRAYLGASRSSRERRPNPFTGLDENDNIQMQELRTQLFYAEGIRDLPRLAKKLTDDPDQAGQYVWNRLARETKEALTPYLSERPPSDEARLDDAKAALALDLNRLIQGRPLHHEPGFDNPTWTEQLRDLLPGEGETADTAGIETLRLNRRLMERAFEGEFVEAGMCRPMHVVNIALNLVGGRDLAWQNRKAESFTVSALHAGSYCVGYRDARVYGMGRDHHAISLGTAVAVSGAAASPNMGYHSSPLVTFLLTLFNVRLGWWLGNPGPAGEKTFNRPGPLLAFKPIIAEMLGLTDDRNNYVYLSDGGHFENLGLYEMILRRCRFVVVSDGSADPTYNFEGLGNAISKVRVDFGVPVKFERIFIFPQDRELRPGESRGYCAVGRICYSCVDEPGEGGQGVEDGLLLYIKATLTGNEPKDIYNYSQAHEAFPHESTGDQMYSEEQFESYRELGSHAFDEIWSEVMTTEAPARGPAPAHAVEQFMRAAAERFGPVPACADAPGRARDAWHALPEEVSLIPPS